MTTSSLNPPRLPSQSNWLKFIELEQAGNLECFGGSEYPLYSDVEVRGEISSGLGPYALLNAVPMGSGTTADIVMVLRSFIFEGHEHVSLSNNLKTDVKRFHGGHLPEEITALTSLALGIRLKAGDANRYFDASDRLGRFVAYSSRPWPSLSVNPGRPIIPTPKDVLLNDIQARLTTIPTLNAGLYIELVRAARAYQDALWISEIEPHLAWLLFVSAIEIAANAQLASAGSSTENLKELKPELARMVENAGGEDLLNEVAKDLKGLFGSTKKFLMFCEEFMPTEPSERPSLDWMKIEWTWSGLLPILKTVYALRSHALHAGIPFPAPMCRQPDQWRDDNVPAERAITSLAVQTMNGQWVPKDAPIALHTFQYFARGALLNWWDRISINT
ncbi:MULTISPECIES: hypothetical protein [Pseudomonas]|uniref:Apea-like HEPN domain-containing protein n=1 Tax=Pseudomonas tritici TaxID=2745518 RepID=A0A8I0D187_9PSED|nr:MULTISPECIES: hypothetical protein [Pseudomonas]MBP2869962.1 hypothetical protein [Pseudomonas sp. SWRI144]QXH81292.1 hypothetical protein HU722_0014665 [Pseudomonas tritici]